MANTAATSPGTMANVDFGGYTIWQDPDNAKASDNSYSFCSYLASSSYQDYYIKIVKGGTIQGDNQGEDTSTPSSDTYISYGGASDLWGVTLLASDVNSSDFGFAFSAYGDYDGGKHSDYLVATNFGFNIPVGATIDGVLAEVEQRWNGPDYLVDHMRITIYYTETITGPFPTHFNI